MTCLAAVVVFCTVYALILPAITFEKEDCTLPEHTHTEDCYALVAAADNETEDVTVPETENEAETETETGTETETTVVIVPETDTESVTEPETDTEAVTEPAEETETVTETEAEASAEAETETVTETEVETSAEAETETVAETSAETETETDTDAESETLITVDTYAGPEIDTLPAVDPETIYVPEETSAPEEITVPEETTASDDETTEPAGTERVLICGLEEHTHNESCGKPYTDKLFALLPDPAEVMEKLSAYREAGDSEGLDGYISGLRALIDSIRACATDEEQNAALEATEMLLDADGGTINADDAAITVESITAEPVTITRMEEVPDDGTERPVSGGDILTYTFRLATGTTDGESRTGKLGVRFELTGGEFDITDTLIKEPVISDEDGKSVLEGFVTTGAPGECNVSVDVVAGEPGMVRLQLCAGDVVCDGDMVIVGDGENALDEDPDSIAEAAHGDNWKILRDSGWFEEYSDYAYVQDDTDYYAAEMMVNPVFEVATLEKKPSDVQVDERGGENSNDNVSVSKIIAGTELENVFDITLRVTTSSEIQELITEPDMAVVIVMDISNTMKENFGGSTRYEAAMDAAESFLDKFASSNKTGVSKVGYVAFNTDAHLIFGLQKCTNKNEADNLKGKMRSETGRIINADGYSASHSRFTNIEAGLKMASDMLGDVNNEHKYIIFLSDGFPTTYISSGYNGYDPYDTTGARFYDKVLNKPCTYGTSYSDEAAIRARNEANRIKNSGIKIFSIGVDVGGQTIQHYITQSEKANGFSVVDRTGKTYEIGSATSSDAYKNWLGNSIGSGEGYYHDSTNTDGLKKAYDEIFKTIKEQVENGSKADWVAEDPMPTINGSAAHVEFIGFYDKIPTLKNDKLEGAYEPDGENTASFDTARKAISWDLKKSGYQTETNGGKTKYTYALVYRVRLINENGNFGEETVYPTNDRTTLRYRTIENNKVSEPKEIEFPIPSVHGFLGELEFKKISMNGTPIPGAVFTLSHDAGNCDKCRGDGNPVDVPNMTAEPSDENGAVSFKSIPSGHKYILEETTVPPGYSKTGDKYTVEVAYNVVTLKENGVTVDDLTHFTIINTPHTVLPSTGSTGKIPYTISGVMLITASILLVYKTRRRDD